MIGKDLKDKSLSYCVYSMYVNDFGCVGMILFWPISEVDEAIHLLSLAELK